MHGQMILTQIEAYLVQLSRGDVKLPEKLVDELSKNIKTSLTRDHGDEFTLRMSNLGRPLCQLQMQKKGAERIPKREKQQSTIFATGHMLEAWLVMIMKAAGVPIVGEQTACSVDIDGNVISGTSDIIIDYGNDHAVWDVKSASKYSFSKFKEGYGAIEENDSFGYITQGEMYSEAHGMPFGGWVVVNKDNGEICVCETPINGMSAETYTVVASKIHVLDTNMPFKRCFEDIEETFYKKPTGNRVLPFACDWCDYKRECWPDLMMEPAIFSKAKSRSTVSYTEINARPEDK
jgi:hypothetical protein